MHIELKQRWMEFILWRFVYQKPIIRIEESFLSIRITDANLYRVCEDLNRGKNRGI